MKSGFAFHLACAGTITLMEGSRRSKEPFKELTNITIQGTQTPHHVDPKERDREGKRRKGEQGAIQHIPNHRQVYTWRYRGDLGENKDRLHVGTDVGTGLINDKATLGEMEDLCNQSCISPLCEGENIRPAPNDTNDATGTQTQPSVVDQLYSMPPHGGQGRDTCLYGRGRLRREIIFEEDEEEDEGHNFWRSRT
ncbi:uncharacterized protein [Setaria viridis]|uniref:uncharacterized protein isoform X18 n=1 Tax=Setaria viridis TaxID=4556 RepID=UPI003B3A1CB5